MRSGQPSIGATVLVLVILAMLTMTLSSFIPPQTQSDLTLCDGFNEALKQCKQYQGIN